MIFNDEGYQNFGAYLGYWNSAQGDATFRFVVGGEGGLLIDCSNAYGSAGPIMFQTSDTERARFDGDTGAFLIGTNSLNYTSQLLQIAGAFSSDNGDIYSSGSGNLTVEGSASFANGGFTIGEDGTATFGINSNTTSPSTNIDANGNINIPDGIDASIRIGDDSGNDTVIIQSQGLILGTNAEYVALTYLYNDGSAQFANTNLTIDTAGNLAAATVTCTPASAPGLPTEGQIYFNTSSKHFYGYNGTSWVQLD